jgi:carboxypeptidase PM20D1
VHLKILAENEAPPVGDLATPSGQAFTRTLREVFPDAVVGGFITTGATDSRYYSGLTSNIYRMAPFRTGPDFTERMHGTNERVAVKDLEDATRFYIRLLQNTAQ